MNKYKNISTLLKEHGLANEPLSSYADLVDLSHKGIPSKGLNSLMKYLDISSEEAASIMGMSTSTFQRRLKSRKLNVDEGERLIQIYQLISKGLEVFGNKTDLNEWLKTKNIAINNEKPLKLMGSHLGRDEAMDLLGRIEHGIYS